MKLKRSISILSSLVILGIFSTPTFASEKEPNKIMPSIEEQLNDFQEFEESINDGDAKIYNDKELDASLKSVPATFATSGTYPTRKGVILVTDGLRVDSLVGHAGIVTKEGQAIESFPDGGVQYKSAKWTTRYKKVWGVTTSGTAASQDAAAADWAVSKKGKPYNMNFFDIENTNKFYCSQLVYKAYKTKTGVNVNWLGGIVTPADIVNTTKTYTIYKFTK
ncbi:hypothetical protein M3699_12845 [Peribacillus simplex]|uniref:YiiX/YebB-like N1pC/P60 family cysteine hydrolase n=1 Tax=Peribacillus simplex TaxID=1478 RepID=UPI002040D984|nr:YiiX/YebB-like N1pC/P60 family cysteine hydrolase [Peribacillus simplex]MCM3674749.1 hypothetical protein [Peribacillus simplex]